MMSPFSSSLGETTHRIQNRFCILKLFTRCQIWPCEGQSHKWLLSSMIIPSNPGWTMMQYYVTCIPKHKHNCADLKSMAQYLPFQKLTFLHFCWIYSSLNFCFSFHSLLHYLLSFYEDNGCHHYTFSQKGRNVFSSLYCRKPRQLHKCRAKIITCW